MSRASASAAGRAWRRGAAGAALALLAAGGASAAPSCLGYSGLPAGFPHKPRAGMVPIPAAAIRLGQLDGLPEEAPSGERVAIGAFWIDRTEVTNAQFARFVQATGYVTDAEREGAAAVFRAPVRGRPSRRDGDWWHWQRGASWRMPEGPDSAARARPNEPVVLVTYHDALAYARWLGRDLPTEAEWEYAARGAGAPEQLEREPRGPGGRPLANYWQGLFPDANTKDDGFLRLAPAGCFPANGWGLADMIGNAWELTRDVFRGPHQPHGNGDPNLAPAAARAVPRRGERMVIKGGSFLCAANYCMRYRSTARQPQEADMATSHVGFRTVLRAGDRTAATARD